ncbi:MAG: cation transporter [Elusimicrobia bacterium]|nr:cation transporter [Elusimicrobiota bacterium]
MPIPRPRNLILQSLLAAFILAVLKILAGWLSNSLGVLASALDSVMDLFSSSVNYFSVRMAEKPADKEHPYGHGKVESLAGAAQGVIISVSGMILLAESIRRVIWGSNLSLGWSSLGVMVLSTAVSGVQGFRLSRAAFETQSQILRAEGLHFSMDVLANLGVLLALMVMRWGAPPVWDILISILVSGYILKESLTLLGNSVQELMDRSLSEDIHSEIERVIRSHHPSVVGFHELRTRRSGLKYFIDFHIEISGVDNFEEAHEITESLIDKLKSRIPNADVTVHYDPKGAR